MQVVVQESGSRPLNSLHEESIQYAKKAMDPIDEARCKELESGALPEWLRHELRMIPPEGKLGLKFSQEMEAMLKRVAPEWDPAAQPLRFALLDRKEPNACIVSRANPPIVCFHRACFLPGGFGSVDLVAAVLAHEVVHKLFKDKYKPQSTTKVEEAVADLAPMSRLYDAGFDPREYARFLSFHVAKGESTKIGHLLQVVFDEHPSDESRLTLCQAGLTKLTKERGTLEAERTLIERDHLLYKIARASRYVSLYAQGSGQQNAASLSPAAVLRRMTDYVISPQLLPDHTAEDLAKELREMRETGKSAPAESVSALADALLARVVRNERELTPCILVWKGLTELVSGETEKLLPLGRLAAIDNEARAFVSAASAKDAAAAAKRLVAAVQAEPICKRSLKKVQPTRRMRLPLGSIQMPFQDSLAVLTREITWTRFVVAIETDGLSKKFMPVPAPWNNHLGWARGASKAERRSIAYALAITGITEPRVLEMLSPRRRLEYAAGLIPEIGRGPKMEEFVNGKRWREHETTHPLLDDEGRILCDMGSAGLGSGIPGDVLRAYEKKMVAFYTGAIERGFAALLESGKTGAKRFIRSASLRRERFSIRRGFFLPDEDYESPPLVGLAACIDYPRIFIKVNHVSLEDAEGQSALAGELRRRASVGLLSAQNIKDLLLPFKRTKKSSGGLVLFPFERNRLVSMDGTEMADADKALRASPMLQFVLDAPETLLSPKDKLEILDRCVSWKGLLPAAPSEGFLRRAEYWVDFGGPAAKDLRALVHQIVPEYPVDGVKRWEALLEISKNEVLQSLPCAKELLYLEAWRLSTRLFQGFRRENLRPQPAAAFLKILPPRPLKDRKNPVPIALRYQFPAKIEWSGRLAKRAREWVELHNSNLLAPLTAYRELSQLLDILSAAEEGIEKARAYEILLTTGRERIADPRLRSLIVCAWAKAAAAAEGLDDGSPEYAARIVGRLKRVRPEVPVFDRPAVFDALASEVQAQARLAGCVKEELGEIGKKAFRQLAVGSVMSELLLQGARYSTKLRRGIIEFLIEPATPKSASRVLKLIYETPRRSLELKKDPIERPEDRMLRRMEEERMTLFHDNFWAAPLDLRALLVRELLVPPFPGEQEIAARYAIDLVFPKGKKGNAYIRSLVSSYLGGLPDYMQPYGLSAMVAAAHKTHSSPKKSAGLGPSIAALLEGLGPATVKAGQAAEGHPSTPEDIRPALRRLKSRAAPPPRWDLMTLFNESVPEEERSRVKYVGSLLGSASFYVTADIVWEDGTPKVISLLRPYAVEQAQAGFGYLDTALGRMREHQETNEILRHHIGVAKSFVRTETSCLLVPKAHAAAAEVYGPMSVEVDGRRYCFAVPRILAAGEKFFVSDKMRGCHVLDLPTAGADDLRYKRGVTKALAASELSLWLSGRRFDSDRHGGNSRVEGNVIGHFDLWGFLSGPPSPKGLEMLGGILGSSLGRARSSHGFLSAFTEATKSEAARSGAESPYLSRVQKALLALAEYHDLFGVTDLIDILGASLVHAAPQARDALEAELRKSLYGREVAKRVLREPEATKIFVE